MSVAHVGIDPEYDEAKERPLEDAYAQGIQAFKDGKSLYENPYLDKPECEVKSRYFIDGWCAAHAGWPELFPRFLPFNATFK